MLVRLLEAPRLYYSQPCTSLGQLPSFSFFSPVWLVPLLFLSPSHSSCPFLTNPFAVNTSCDSLRRHIILTLKAVFGSYRTPRLDTHLLGFFPLIVRLTGADRYDSQYSASTFLFDLFLGSLLLFKFSFLTLVLPSLQCFSASVPVLMRSGGQDLPLTRPDLLYVLASLWDKATRPLAQTPSSSSQQNGPRNGTDTEGTESDSDSDLEAVLVPSSRIDVFQAVSDSPVGIISSPSPSIIYRRASFLRT